MKTGIPNDGFSPAPPPAGMNAPDAPPLPQGPAPEPHFEESVCMKGATGKCEHLWQIVTSFASGNPAGTFAPGEEPKGVHRSCMRGPGEELDLSGLKVISCSEHSDLAHRKDPKPFDFTDPNAPKPDLSNIPRVNLKKDTK
jgi:hypothetical protein